MRKLLIPFVLLFLACKPEDPNSIINDLSLVQVVDNSEKSQEFIADTDSFSFTTRSVQETVFCKRYVKYTQISFKEHNASQVYMNLGRKYKILIMPISTLGELTEIQNRIGKDFVNSKLETKDVGAVPVGVEEKQEGITK